MPPPSPQATELRPSQWRDRVAVWLAIATAGCLVALLMGSAGLTVLMPGPLASAHGGVAACKTCHTTSGTSKLSWLHGFVAGDRAADSKACLTCHKMPETALNAHSAPTDVLRESTVRLTKLAMETPNSGLGSGPGPVQILLSTPHNGGGDALACGTCHQEHQGTTFDLRKISNEQCRSCHVLKFDRFDTDHPQFSAYPFERRTRVVFDHAGHFGKHYPETAKKDPDKRIPETCSSCHDSRRDPRIMALMPFEKTCATCHADQITGKERVSGPKGVAFLALPGLDLETLKAKKAAIGEWPQDSEAMLTPFMRVVIGRTDKGRALLARLDGINLQDLSGASEAQITSVVDMAWEIKRLLHALIGGKASDVLADLNIVQGAKLSASLVGDLTAGLPRDVLLGAQQQWLPNLATEIAHGPMAADESRKPEPPAQEPPAVAEPEPQATEPDTAVESATQAQSAGKKNNRDPPACVLRVLGSCLVAKEQGAQSGGSDAAGGTDSGAALADNPAPPLRLMPPSAFANPMRAGLQDVAPPKRIEIAQAAKPADDLLSPTEEEMRELKARNARSARQQPAPAGTSPGEAAPMQPVITIDSGVEPENWADVGGWYRQDHTIFYKPAGHKDKFIYSWLFLTGPLAPRDGTGPLSGPISGVFNSLTGKDAVGVCTKCHSIDDLQGRGRVVNFSPQVAADKAGRFTSFVHEPHLTISDDRGCLTCHSLTKDRTYLKSYEQGAVKTFQSNFDPIKRDVCQTCHTQDKARQDCQLCHRYHVNGVVTPAMQTKLPVR